MNVLRISVLAIMIISFAACNYRYNVEKMRADMEAAWENGDDETYNRLSKQLDEINDPKITPNDMMNAVIKHFSYELNIDRMIDDYKIAINEDETRTRMDELNDRLVDLKMTDDQVGIAEPLYMLYADRLLNEFEASINDRDEETKEYLLDRMTKLKKDSEAHTYENGFLMDEAQKARWESLMTDSGEY